MSHQVRFIFKKTYILVAFLNVSLALSSFNIVFAQNNSQDQPAAAGKYPAFGQNPKKSVLLHGAKVYQTYCMGCHGAQGDGNGPAAMFLDPKPRNFKIAQFRFSSRVSGELPTDEDLYRTVTEGLRGTSMPSWALLPEDDRRAVITYIKTFAKDTWENAFSSPPTTIGDDPYYAQDKKEAIDRGKIVYHGMAQCYSCHAAYIGPKGINAARASYKMPMLQGFRQDLGSPRVLPNEDGTLMRPPDFTWDSLKRGSDERTLYHVIGNGIGGVAMPTWKGVFSEEDLWALVYYVQSLAKEKPSRVTEEELKKHQEKIAALERERLDFEAEMKIEQLEKAKKDAAAKLEAEAKAKEAAAALTLKAEA